MATTVFPVAVASSSSSPNAYSATIPLTNQKYNVVQSFSPGAYTITTSPSSSQATVNFYNSTSVTADTVTISGTVTYLLSSAATGAYIQTSGDPAVVVTITLVAGSLTPSTLSGTLDTITTTSTYNQTGKLYVLAFGGGGSAGGYQSTYGSGGGGSGYQTAKIVYANGPTSITIGAGGTTNGQNGNSGGTTNFGNLVSASGGGGASGPNAGGGAGNGSNSSTPPGNGSFGPNASAIIASVITNSTTGGGGGGYGNGAFAGAGSGIGTGGSGSNNAQGGNATGYAAGGGGGGYSSAGGGTGSQGIVYVLRGIS
jgi:hypothetical protein